MEITDQIMCATMIDGALSIIALLVAYRQAYSAIIDEPEKIMDTLVKHTVRAKQTVKQHRVYTFLPRPPHRGGIIAREDKS